MSFYEQVFNEGQAGLYPNLVSAPYIQHNPLVAPMALMASWRFSQKWPDASPARLKTRWPSIRDLAFVPCAFYLNLFSVNKRTAGVDIFRFDANGKNFGALGLWLQPVPATAKKQTTPCF